MEILDKYKYPILGGLSGFILAICFFSIGFWKTILLLILVAIGVFAGIYIQRTGLINQIFKK